MRIFTRDNIFLELRYFRWRSGDQGVGRRGLTVVRGGGAKPLADSSLGNLVFQVSQALGMAAPLFKRKSASDLAVISDVTCRK